MINFHTFESFKKNILLFLTLNLFSSCSIFSNKQVKIVSNSLSGKTVYFAELDKSYRRTKNFSKEWSKIYSNKFRSYHKFISKEYVIKGQMVYMDKDFLVIGSKKNKLYKTLIKFDRDGEIILPSYIYFKDDQKAAESLIGKSIWLNYLNDKNIFFSYMGHNFQRFNKVEVIGVIKLTNNSSDIPIWLKIKSLSLIHI